MGMYEFLPFARIVAERLCFHNHLSFCSRGEGACVAQGHAWQGDGIHGRGHAWQGSMHCRGMHDRGHAWQKGHAWQEAGETATAADSTHPTGMHSCFLYFQLFKKNCKFYNYFLGE